MAEPQDNIIKIKRSSSASSPASLTAGELAYSYLSGQLFIGSTAGTPLAIGGENFVSGATSIGFNTKSGTDTIYLGETLTLTGTNGISVTSNASNNTIYIGLSATGATKGDGGPILTVEKTPNDVLVFGIADGGIENAKISDGTIGGSKLASGGLTARAFDSGTIKNFEVNNFSSARPDKSRIVFYDTNKTGYDPTAAQESFAALDGGTGYIDIAPMYWKILNPSGVVSFIQSDVTGGSLDSVKFAGTTGFTYTFSTALTANEASGTLTITPSIDPITFSVPGKSIEVDLGGTLEITGTANEVEITTLGNAVVFGLPDAVTVTSLSATSLSGGSLSVSGTSTLGNVTSSGTITGANIRATSSSTLASASATSLVVSGSSTLGSVSASTLTAASLGVTGNLSVDGDATINGNLTVSGSLVTLDVTNVQIEDAVILLSKGNTADNVDSGFLVEYEEFSAPRYAGLIRDRSILSKPFVLVDGITNISQTTFTSYEKGNLIVSDLNSETLSVSSNISMSSVGITANAIFACVIDCGEFDDVPSGEA